MHAWLGRGGGGQRGQCRTLLLYRVSPGSEELTAAKKKLPPKDAKNEPLDIINPSTLGARDDEVTKHVPVFVLTHLCQIVRDGSVEPWGRLPHCGWFKAVVTALSRDGLLVAFAVS